MPTEVTLPQLGESVDSGTIVAWLVEVGDEVGPDQPLVEVSTDKVDTEIPSPASGTVARLLVDVDDVVAVGQPLLLLDGDGDDPGQDSPPAAEPVGAAPAPAAPTAAPPRAPERERPVDAVQDDEGHLLSPLVKRLLREHGLSPSGLEGTGRDGRITPDDVRSAAGRARPRLSPLVKRLLREHDLVPSGVVGSGRDGRITPDDVLSAVAAPAASPAASPERPSSTTGPTGVQSAAPAARPAAATPHRLPGDRVEPLSRTRRVIAERMVDSLASTAQLTAAVEADVTQIMHVRAAVNGAHKSRYGTGLSPLAFIARATVRTLQRHPLLNASIDIEGGEVVFHTAVNLGIAVDAPQGLVVPTIRDAQDVNVVGLQRRITDLGTRARDRKLTPDDVGNGTFTITNTGSRGSLFDTPILNPPEVGILATPTIEKRPVVVTDEFGNDTFAVRHRTYLCLTYDHRLVDGADAARFLSDLAADLDRDTWHQEVAELS